MTTCDRYLERLSVDVRALARQPRVVVALLSLGAPLTLAEVSPGTRVALLIMHLLAAILIIGVLAGLAHARAIGIHRTASSAAAPTFREAHCHSSITAVSRPVTAP